eukprot:TRINITY_DN2900_c0_g1_i1.p1 TRINITY_DN2900_c0_g1~~TRINITY_DN2900_c0_g1_i1.p1  ORF type:complete len:417 (-),score=93.40 TRINITY_DN2900_c0_g1_i1:326-1576(-)
MAERYRPQSAFPLNTTPWAEVTKTERPATVAEGSVRTSPVKLPRAVNRIHRPQSTGSIMHQRLSERRPTQLPAAADGSLMVEGCQTGQPVQVQEVVVRRPLSSMTSPLRPSRPPTAMSTSARDTADGEQILSSTTEAQLQRERKENQKDKATIRRLEAEVKRLKDLLAERDREVSELNRHIADLEKKLTVDTERLRGEALALQLQLTASQTEKDETRSRVKDLRDEGDTLRAAMESQRRQHAQREEELGNTLADLRDKVRQLEQQASAASRSEAQTLQRRRDEERQRDQQLAQLRDELQQQTLKLQKLQSQEVERSKRDARSEVELANLQERMQKFYTYIQKICQPQFSVVKDESLTPINPTGFSVVEGHVLVPLVLLLEGYAFLPVTMRDTYNQSDYNPPTTQTLAARGLTLQHR